MTVNELRALLARFPGDDPVTIHVGGESQLGGEWHILTARCRARSVTRDEEGVIIGGEAETNENGGAA